MKRPLIITAGIVIILGILGLWVYLLLFGTPKKAGDVFTNLGILPQEEIVVEEQTNEGSNQTQLGLTTTELQQLTTRAVAGYTFASSSSAELIRYVETGTGHVYEINLDTGTEEQISNTTIPQTVSALFSPDAQTVVFSSIEEDEIVTSAGILTDSNSGMSLSKLPRGTQNVSFKDTKVIYFSVSNNGATTLYAYSIASLSESELFSVAMQDINIRWGNGIEQIYIHTKPTQHLEGYIYAVSNGRLTPVGTSEYGLTALINKDKMILSYISDEIYTSAVVNSNNTTQQAVLMIPEKCVFTNNSSENVWCGSPIINPGVDYLESWYKGAVISEDYLWLTHLPTQTSTLIGDLSTLSGRTLDVTDLQINSYSSLLLFKNKIDQTLWLYKIGE